MLELFNKPLFARGFRPFFILAALYSVINLLIWGGFYAGTITPPDIFLGPVLWHSHEMIYGFAIAVISGFLLTAVANWTGGAPARQIHLAGLCAIWLAGRIVMNFDIGLPHYIIFIIEGAFIPALAISLAIPLLKSWNKRNFVFLVLLSILFACDIIFLLTEASTPLYIAVMVIVAMMSLVGGRIIPAFTVAAIRRRGDDAYQTPQNKLDILALLSLALIILALIFIGQDGIILAGVSLASASIHILRIRHYHTIKILNDSMVWILHAGYIWIIIGLLLIGVSALGFLPFSTALHALTAGAIGSMTLGMMCRVSLGHTGRALASNTITIIMFYSMQLAAILRVFGLMIFPEYTTELMIISASLWSICFGLYVITYTPMLIHSRPDGRAN